ncbi:MAG: 30S ribosome-binding factor RbfA [Opitutales bacterium]|nr:30S ribosome-binding factor RbfA [Opitutales bacterium]MBP3357992.1 30S ribosome-binding factor RbfA [Opitutales bacterium]MBQ2722676.1 30S ribosome-binding factor RbfA [Opitutales bacterium]MBR7106147.1 30S ribosome-binding factor RbfA [Opitutales bacterium]
MGQRKIRVGELIRRELSEILHSRWRTETVAMTITEVDISPDLRNARVYYSVIGNRENVAKVGRLLASIKRDLKQLLSKKVILKYTPELNFVFDPSAERAMKILATLDELDEAERMENENKDEDNSADN